MIDGPVRSQPFKYSMRIGVASLALVVSGFALVAAQAPTRQVTQSVSATVTFKQRTSLQLSTNVLRFDVNDTAAHATATVDFTAGARVSPSDQVELVFEPIDSVSGVLAVVEGPMGTISGDVPAKATVVARWSGGGLRAGRLTFRLTGVARGHYEVPFSLRLTVS